VRLENKVAIVTGGGRGNGRAIALGFAREGADVAVADINLDNAKSVAGGIRDLGRRGFPVRVDVADRVSVENMVEEVYKEFDRVDILVNNAGVIGRVPFLEVSEEEWDRVLDINLKGAFLCGQAVAKRMVEAGNGGVIINITSIMTERTTPTTVPYCASKGGLRTLTNGMAVALAPYNIRVNAISPPIIWTDMSDALLSKTEVRETIRSKIPLNRIAEPEVLVGAAIYLASDESSYVTGSTLSVDGGMSAM